MKFIESLIFLSAVQGFTFYRSSVCRQIQKQTVLSPQLHLVFRRSSNSISDRQRRPLLALDDDEDDFGEMDGDIDMPDDAEVEDIDLSGDDDDDDEDGEEAKSSADDGEEDEEGEIFEEDEEESAPTKPTTPDASTNTVEEIQRMDLNDDNFEDFDEEDELDEEDYYYEEEDEVEPYDGDTTPDDELEDFEMNEEELEARMKEDMRLAQERVDRVHENFRQYANKLDDLKFKNTNRTVTYYGEYGDLGTNNLDETNPFYPEDPEIDYDDGRQWNFTNLMYAAVKRNPSRPIAQAYWIEAMRKEMGVKEVDLMNEQYEFKFSDEDIESADISELEDYYANRGRVLPVPEDQETKEETEARLDAMSREIFDDEPEGGAPEPSMYDRWQSWYTHVYEEDGLEELYTELETDEETMQDKIKWEFGGQDVAAEEIELIEKGLTGKLVIANGGQREDLVLSELIATKIEEEFGEKVIVETQVFPEATKDDFLFEIWIEAYEHELLFSRRRAVFEKSWGGSQEFGPNEMEKLLKDVSFHMSDDSRYSYKFENYEED